MTLMQLERICESTAVINNALNTISRIAKSGHHFFIGKSTGNNDINFIKEQHLHPHNGYADFKILYESQDTALVDQITNKLITQAKQLYPNSCDNAAYLPYSFSDLPMNSYSDMSYIYLAWSKAF